MDSFVSVRIEPVKESEYIGHAAEASREIVPRYADSERLKLNRYWRKPPSADELRDSIAELRKKNGQQALRKDARLAFSGIITFSHEAQEEFDRLEQRKQIEIYTDICKEISHAHNTQVLFIAQHNDETAPHCHFFISAYDKGGKALRLNPRDTSMLQDIAGKVLQNHGVKIERGKTIAQRIEESEQTGEPANIENKSVYDLHRTMANDLKKANKIIKIQQKQTRKLLDFNALKKFNLGDVLERFGYIFNKKESSTATKKYESDTDTLIVKKASSGDYVYFNTQDDTDCGTVIDFCKNRKIDLHTIQTANVLQQETQHVTKIKKADKELPNFKDDFLKLRPYNAPYLTNTRKIRAEIVAAFNVRQDAKNNACFPHYTIMPDRSQLTGWEVKNAGFTGFNKGGSRGLGLTRIGDGEIRSIVVCESSIDAMSYMQLFDTTDNTLFISTGGSLTAKQLEQIKEIANRYKDADVVAATDNDLPGQIYADKISQAIPRTVRQTPQQKDWNDDLKQRAEANTARVRHF